MRKIIRIFLIVVFAVGVFVFVKNDYYAYLSLDHIKNSLETFKLYDSYNPYLTRISFFLAYVAIVAMTIPGATALTLLAGALYGLFWGTILVSFAASIGSALAFLASRYLFRDWVLQKFDDKVKMFDEGLKKDGIFYLLSLRLMPIFPFFLINIIMGLSNMSVITFYWVSQLGMLAATLVYVQAGVELAQINSLSEIFSLRLFLIFSVLAVLPWLFKSILVFIKHNKDNSNAVCKK